MSLPPPSLTVPTLLADQVSFQGVTIGYPPNTPYGITDIDGLDKPDVRSGNQNRPRTRGAFVGANYLNTRKPTLTLDIGPPFGSYTDLPTALGSLRAACSTEGTTEYPLWVQLPGFPLVCSMSRVIKTAGLKWTVESDLGQLIRGASIQWEATDPYLYSAPTQSVSVNLPTPGVGFKFPITFPWSFGDGTGANSLTAVNNGDVNCWPVLVITGPCLNPSVSNSSVDGGPTLTFNIQMNAGDQLVVDCDMESILFYAAGSTVGVPYPEVLNSGSTFFAVEPGSNSIAFNSADTVAAAGTLDVWYASAYSGLL